MGDVTTANRRTGARVGAASALAAATGSALKSR